MEFFLSLLIYTIIIREDKQEAWKGRCVMDGLKVERLLINYKTLEDFKKFQAYGSQELSMLRDLENELVENDSESPFYGVYYGKKLIARMSLYKRSKEYDHYFNPPQDYLVLFKLEVLPEYRNRGIGRMMVEFAKSFNLPIKTNPAFGSGAFWEKMGFEAASYNLERDLGENPYIWLPPGVKESIQPPVSRKEVTKETLKQESEQ